MTLSTESTDEYELPVPVGEYKLAVGYTSFRVLVGLVAGIGFLLMAVYGLPVDSALQNVLIRTLGAVCGVPMALYSLGLIRRLRAEPRLKITKEGIHIIPEVGLASLFALFRTPKEELIPWSAFRSFAPGPGPVSSVVIEYDGYEEPLWRRLLLRRRHLPRGRLVSVGDLDLSGLDLRDQLTSWSEERQALATRAAAHRLRQERETQKQLKEPTEEDIPHRRSPGQS